MMSFLFCFLLLMVRSFLFNGVEVGLFGTEDDVIEVFGPVAKGAFVVEVGAGDFGCAVFWVARKPVEVYAIVGEAVVCDEGLNAAQEEGAVGFDDDAYAALCGVGEDGGHGGLCAGVQVDFRLFYVDELVWFCGEECDEDGEGLRYAKADVGDVYGVFCAASFSVGRPAYA